ncbi:MAG TPA: acyl-ACP thioesterase domain-containing protein [Anaeromyxobacteraceae bacterium]
MEHRRDRYAVHGVDADAFGLLSGPSLAGYLQESASRHAEALGVGEPALRARGLAWVLWRQRIEVLRLPCRGEELAVETWPSGVERLAAQRDFRVTAAGGDELVRARTAWLVMDLASRRPVRPDRALEGRLREPASHVLEWAGDLPDLPAASLERRFAVRFADLDANLHVNNTTYLAWALEAVSQDDWRERVLAALEVAFAAECGLGSTVLSRSAPSASGQLLHALVREEDGKVLARLRTAWRPRRPSERDPGTARPDSHSPA